jgi:hypothetical protein
MKLIALIVCLTGVFIEYPQTNPVYLYNLGASAVKMSGPSRVTTTVCSNWADRLPSIALAVQPSDSIFTFGLPAVNIGSIVITMPSSKRTPLPGLPVCFTEGHS